MIELIEHPTSYELTDTKTGMKRFCSVETLLDTLAEMGVDTSTLRTQPNADDLDIFRIAFQNEVAFRKAKKWIAENLKQRSARMSLLGRYATPAKRL